MSHTPTPYVDEAGFLCATGSNGIRFPMYSLERIVGSQSEDEADRAFIIRACNAYAYPDSTRAALEECVSAMEQAMQRSNESGTGTLSLVDTIHAVHGILREAHATARKSLQGE